MLETLGILGTLYLIFGSLPPDGDARKHKATVKTERIEVTVVARDVRDAVDFVREAASGGLIDAVLLCPGFTMRRWRR